MKKFILLLLLIWFTMPYGFAQMSNREKIEQISAMDKKIYEIKHLDIKTLSKRIIKKLTNAQDSSENNLDTVAIRLYNILEIENPLIPTDTLLFFLENVRSYESVFELYNRLNNKILYLEEDLSINDDHTNETYVGGLRRNLSIIKDHLKHILKYEFCQYKNINTSNQAIKGIYFSTDNDLFAYNNHDMNYTGGGRLEITTDFLKMRLLRIANSEKILSYQGIFIGFKAYTPFIRDTSIFKTPTSFDVNDRPFASYTFIGRSKYRIHSSGHMRMRSDISVGTIGGNVGNIVQSIIHRDQFVSSVKPYGWESQIANGGRFAWNIDHCFELMLFSGNGDIFRLDRKKPHWVNIPLIGSLSIGNELTAIGSGIGFSNLSFKDRSGNEDLKSNQLKKFRFLISANAMYRYVVHNSMLEGIGILETFPADDDPLAPKDVYRLEPQDVIRHLFISELFIGFRTMKTTLYWKLTINSKEYNKPKAKEIYQWARIGVNFLL